MCAWVFAHGCSSDARNSSGTLSAARLRLSATSRSDLANLPTANLCAFSTSIAARRRAFSASASARSTWSCFEATCASRSSIFACSSSSADGAASPSAAASASAASASAAAAPLALPPKTTPLAFRLRRECASAVNQQRQRLMRHGGASESAAMDNCVASSASEHCFKGRSRWTATRSCDHVPVTCPSSHILSAGADVALQLINYREDKLTGQHTRPTHCRISILPNGMYDAQYHASAQNCTKIATSVRSAWRRKSAATTVTQMLPKYASVAKMRTGDAICSSCAFGPTRKALLARPSTLPTEYFHAN